MKAKAWLTLELEETRTGSGASRQLKITGVRQTQPLERLSVEIELEVPDDVIMPKAKLLVEHEEDVRLELSERERPEDSGEERGY